MAPCDWLGGWEHTFFWESFTAFNSDLGGDLKLENGTLCKLPNLPTNQSGPHSSKFHVSIFAWFPVW